MAGRTSYYGGIISDGLVFHLDAAKQESFSKRGIRYAQAGNSNLWIDFADLSKNPSAANATGSVISGATFSNFAPYHLSGYLPDSNFYVRYWHDPSSTPWRSSAGIGTFYGNIELDGIDDYVSFGATPELTGITDITVSSWVYINRFRGSISPSGGTTSIIASRYSNTTNFNGWELGFDNNGVAWFGGRETTGVDNYIVATSSYLVKARDTGGFTANGGWYNIVGTKQGNNWKVYVAPTNKYRDVNYPMFIRSATYSNELRGATAKGSGTTVFGPNNLVLGKASNTNQYYMNGRIMQLSIYNRALSPAEISKNYESFSKRVFELEGIPLEACPGQRVVFQICNSNAAHDDNFDIYLNGTASVNKIGSVDLSQDALVGSIFIGDLDPSITLASGDFTCPVENMVIYRFDPVLLKANNMIYMKNTQNNGGGNFGQIGVRNYLLSGSTLSSPCLIANLTYGYAASGLDLGPYSFQYGYCCQ